MNAHLERLPWILTLALACGGDDERGSASLGSGQITSASGGLTSLGGTTSASEGSGSAGESEGESDGGTGGTAPASSTSGGPGGDPSGSTTTGEDTSGTTTTGSTTGDTEGACAEVVVMAENKVKPADIIFAIDNSGSMDFEEKEVQSNMNAFSQTIVQAGVDVHVVLISNNNICIAAPLGSGACPNDSKPPKYLHVPVGIGSNDALAKILSTHEEWKDMMRPDSQKHVVVVSDDDAKGVVASGFDPMFKGLGPSYQGYKFHAIVGLWDMKDVLKCLDDPVCCATIAAEGKEHKKLVSWTGGVLGPLCVGGKQKFGELFATLSTEVIEEATIACEWTIPDAMGMEIDFGKVNVDYHDGQGGVQAIPKVMDAGACGGLDAWYYDDNAMPTKIFACPALCMKIQGNLKAKVDVKFGCESLIPQ